MILYDVHALRAHVSVRVKVVMEKDGAYLDHLRNEEVLLRVKEQRNILHEILKLSYL